MHESTLKNQSPLLRKNALRVRLVADANRSRAFAIAGLRSIGKLSGFFHRTESRLKVWASSMRPHNQIKNNKNPITETSHAFVTPLRDTYLHVCAVSDFKQFLQHLTAVLTLSLRRRLLLASALLLSLCAMSAHAIECIVPAKPGGGMDGACKMMRKVLPANLADKDGASAEVKISYLPGGIGAVAWSSVVSKRRGGADTLVTFSGGSLLNLAQGKYGKAAVSDVRWLAAVGADYGMIAVRSDAPYKNLRDLLDAMGNDPGKITIGVSGTVGSQDWLKVAMLARRADIDPKNFRFVALEGGGDSFTALQANHVQVISGDASEAAAYIKEGRFRILAVLSEQRLPGVLAGVVTAREQGFDVVWPIIRGFYMSAHASDDDYQRWIAVFDRTMATEEFKRQRAASGLYPFAMTGPQLTEYVRKVVEQYRKQSQELGLVR